MNQQELADLFSAQIDRLLGGESAVDLAIEGDLPLLALGQQLTQISFQANPAAQAAFQSQLASWFGPTGGGSLSTVFGLPKILLMSLGAVLVVMSAGLSSVVLISFIWTGALFNLTNESRPRPSEPVVAPPALASPEVTQSPAVVTPTATQRGTSSLKDVLPAATTSVGDTILPTATTAVGDTIPRPIATPTSTDESLAITATPAGNQASDGDDGNDDTSNGTTPEGDRGHGNDPDGYDEDNPGQSEGVSGGNDQNNGNGGISPGNLSGGSGGNSGGGNAGGGGNSNDGNNSGGSGGGNSSGHGGDKGSN